MYQFSQLSLAEKLIIGGGLLIFAAAFLPWFSYSTVDFNGWTAPGAIWSIIAIEIGVLLAAHFAYMAMGNASLINLPRNLTWGKLYIGAAGAMIVAMLLKLWRIFDFPDGGIDLGFILGAIATGAIAYGAYLIYTKENPAAFRRPQ